MKAHLLFALGIALLVLGAAKIVGVTYLLVCGTDKPSAFLVKQAVYGAAILATGGVAASAGRKQRRSRSGDSI